MSQLALPLIAPPLSQKRSILDILPSSDNLGLSLPSEGHEPIDAENPVIVSKSSAF
jgi:hypothetical protein